MQAVNGLGELGAAQAGGWMRSATWGRDRFYGRNSEKRRTYSHSINEKLFQLNLPDQKLYNFIVEHTVKNIQLG
jgi:hypothetical protein